MNLTEMFETQDKLDDRIIEEKGLQGQDLLDKKILALQVELGELANEWEMFKFWKENPRPRKRALKLNDVGLSTIKKAEITDLKPYACNPLLEEYADCLSFILSIGNDTGMSSVTWTRTELVNYTTLDSFGSMFYHIAQFERYKNSMFYGNIISIFIHLGKCLGFTWEQIEQAYYKKNEINHARQQNGY